MLPVTQVDGARLPCEQLERLEVIWAKLHDMGISRDEDDEDSNALPPPFPYNSTPSARNPSNGFADTPTYSSRHATWYLLCLTCTAQRRGLKVHGCACGSGARLHCFP